MLDSNEKIVELMSSYSMAIWGDKIRIVIELGDIGEEAFPYLEKIAGDPETEYRIRGEAYQSLLNHGWQPDESQMDKMEDVYFLITSRLVSEMHDLYHWKTAYEHVQELGEPRAVVGDARAIDPLTAALKDSSEAVRRDAAKVLERKKGMWLVG